MPKKFTLSKAKRVANISFEGTDYDGLEVRCSLDLPFRTVLEIQKLSASDKDTESVKANTIWCDEVLESWNLTDDEGNDIPATSETALAVVPARLVSALISIGLLSPYITQDFELLSSFLKIIIFLSLS